MPLDGNLDHPASEDPGGRAAPDHGCRSCGASLHWAKVAGGGSTCWFAVCSCGVPAAHFPLRPDYEPDGPGLGRARAPPARPAACPGSGSSS
jgi:hypothetical protein